MSIVQAAIIGSAAGSSGPASGYPIPGSGSWSANAGTSSSNGTPYDPGGSQDSVDNRIYGFYRRAFTGEWFTGSYSATDMTFFNGRTAAESKTDTYVSFGYQADVNSQYSMYWLGYFQAPVTGDYNLSLSSDDDSMVWIGANAVYGFTGSNCVATQGQTTANSLTLTGGKWYPIRLWYHEGSVNNSCQLFIGQAGDYLFNMHYWYAGNRIAYNNVTKGLNVTPRVNAIPGNSWSGLSLQNSPTNNTTYLTFDGDLQSATVTPGLIDSDPSGNFTIEMWVRTTTDNGILVTDGLPDGYNVSLIEFVNGDILAGYWNGTAGVSGTVQSPAGRNYWHHYVYAYNSAGPQLEFFIDGVRTNLNLPAKRAAGTLLSLFHGGTGTNFGDNTYLAGDLGEFRLWDSLLSDAKVQAQYDATKSAYLPTFTLATEGSVTSVDEGTALTFNATTTNVLDSTTLYWTTGSTGSYNLVSGRFSPDVTGSFNVNNNIGTFTITVSADTTTATGSQSYNVLLVDSLSPFHTVGNTVSITVNDTSLSIPQWHDGDVTASGRSVSYRYYKFNITKIRDISQSLGGATQISELIILNGSTKLTGGTATNPGGHQAFEGEGPSKALTGYYDDKWCDTDFAVNGYSTLIIDYTTPQTSTGFTYATANDYPGRDPVRWTFEGSNDGSTWTVIQEQFADATITVNRNTLVSTVFNYPTHGSAVFNQPQTDYVSLPALPDWNLGTTWTVEFWIYMNSSSVAGNQSGGIWGLLNQKGWATKDSINIALSGGYLQINQGNNTSYYNKLVIEPTPLQWVHVAIVNNAGTNKVYYNGIEQVPPASIGSQDYTASWTNSTNPLYIGGLGDSGGGAGAGGSTFDGKLTNLRITDTAVYATNFYPPTVLPTKITNHTRLLWTPTDQDLVIDTSDDPHTITNTGVTYSSSYPSANTTAGSAVFDASTNRFYKVPGGSHLQLGTTWTIEWWQKTTALTAGNGNLYTIMSQSPGGGRIDIFYQSGNLIVQNDQALCAEPPSGVWVHVAIVNNAGSGTVYYNGIAQSATGNFGNYGQTQDLYIGKRGNNTFQYFNGKMTNIRITDTAVYTSGFNPVQIPTLITGNTKLLIIPNFDTINGIDTGDLALALSSSGIRYSSDYPPAHMITVTQNHLNDNGQAVATGSTGASTIPVGATTVLRNVTRTVTNNIDISGDRVIYVTPQPDGSPDTGFIADAQYTFIW